MQTDDCSWKDRLRLCAVLEGRNLGIKGGHDGWPQSESKGAGAKK